VLGPIGAALISTGIWTVLHTQYPGPELLGLFLMGMLLCVIRHKTDSIWLPIALHAINNALGVLVLWSAA